MQQKNPELYAQLKQYANAWPFLRYMLIQIETNLLNADPELMQAYAALVEDEALRSELLTNIMQEHSESIAQVAALLGGSTGQRRTSLLENIHRRRNPLHILHKMQIEKLSEWRSMPDKSTQEAEILLNKLLVITTAISGGVKSTG
jgi:phosphoenolpyruvate carboxylase